MAANGVNRSVQRKALAALLSSALTGTGKPAQAVYAYRVGDFKGQSPVVVVASDGTTRKQIMLNTATREVTVHLVIYTFVLYADPDVNWTESDAEDALDLVEKSVADVLADNRTNANWNLLAVEDRSQIDSVVIGGADYLRETIAVTLKVLLG